MIEQLKTWSKEDLIDLLLFIEEWYFSDITSLEEIIKEFSGGDD